jgi:hypothetical protein
MTSTRSSHRPDFINNLFPVIITWVATGWMVLDSSFTISRAFDAFKPPNFFLRLFVAVAFGVSCAFAQKVLFELLVNSEKRKEWVITPFESGILPKIFLITVAAFAVYLIHFSWMATGNSLGMTKGVFAVPNFGQKELVSASTYITSIFSGLFIAFIDEILFLFATILEPRK